MKGIAILGARCVARAPAGTQVCARARADRCGLCPVRAARAKQWLPARTLEPTSGAAMTTDAARQRVFGSAARGPQPVRDIGVGVRAGPAESRVQFLRHAATTRCVRPAPGVDSAGAGLQPASVGHLGVGRCELGPAEPRREPSPTVRSRDRLRRVAPARRPVRRLHRHRANGRHVGVGRCDLDAEEPRGRPGPTWWPRAGLRRGAAARGSVRRPQRQCRAWRHVGVERAELGAARPRAWPGRTQLPTMTYHASRQRVTLSGQRRHSDAGRYLEWNGVSWSRRTLLSVRQTIGARDGLRRVASASVLLGGPPAAAWAALSDSMTPGVGRCEMGSANPKPGAQRCHAVATTRRASRSSCSRLRQFLSGRPPGCGRRQLGSQEPSNQSAHTMGPRDGLDGAAARVVFGGSGLSGDLAEREWAV